jgi:uncharacterized alkaline shock family protein YloU
MSDYREEGSMGSIHVSPDAIATIASQALLKSYGVVGMASRNVMDGITSAITRDPHHGIGVHTEDGQIVIDVYVIIEHGTRITSVATSVVNSVRFNVQKMLGIPVYQVNIYVQGLRVSKEE